MNPPARQMVGSQLHRQYLSEICWAHKFADRQKNPDYIHWERIISFDSLSKADATFDQAILFPIISGKWGEKNVTRNDRKFPEIVYVASINSWPGQAACSRRCQRQTASSAFWASGLEISDFDT